MKKTIFIKTRASEWEQNHKSNSDDDIDDRVIARKEKQAVKGLLLAPESLKAV
jgi:hypothetical protein